MNVYQFYVFLCFLNFQVNVQNEFRRNSVMPRTDTIRIEHVMRNGYRKLDMMKDPQGGYS